MQKLTIAIFILFFSLSSFGQPKINLTLKKELDSIYIKDQSLRELISSDLLQTKADSISDSYKIAKTELTNYIVKTIPILDSLNLLQIEQIIKKYGYPGKSLVGTGTNEAAYFVIQHSNKIDKYLPLIKKAADENEIEFNLYAKMLDRSLMHKEKEQIYGTQGKGFETTNSETGQIEYKRIIWPISDINKVNDRRKKAGFKTTVEESAKSMGIVFENLSIEEVKQMQGIFSKPQFKNIIDSLYKIDQQVQQDAKNAYQRSGSMDTFQVYEKIELQTFARHSQFIKPLLKKYGYPTYEKVGKESSGNFFSLVQHSEADVKFQEKMLPLIKLQVDKKQFKGSNYAHLYDRVQINNRRQQLYGTQVTYDTNGNAITKSLSDEKNVNKRRKEFNIKPIEEYLKQMTDMHKMNNQKK